MPRPTPGKVVSFLAGASLATIVTVASSSEGRVHTTTATTTTTGPSRATTKRDCAPVRALKALYRRDRKFRATLDAALANVRRRDPAVPNPWEGKKVEDLYAFINE